jgi:hypothetical protein
MPFIARYPGKCAGCGEGISPGRVVEYVDDELVHDGCVPTPERPERPRPVCPECFTETALNGACSCPT